MPNWCQSKLKIKSHLAGNLEREKDMKTSERIEEEAHHSDCPAVDGFGCRCDELETKTEVWFGNMTHGINEKEIDLP